MQLQYAADKPRRAVQMPKLGQYDSVQCEAEDITHVRMGCRYLANGNVSVSRTVSAAKIPALVIYFDCRF